MKLIFKHSGICPVSRRAESEVKKFIEDHGEIDFELIDVLENRSRSREVESELGIKHESPQAIILDDSGNVVWHGSHFRVSYENLLKNSGNVK